MADTLYYRLAKVAMPQFAILAVALDPGKELDQNSQVRFQFNPAGPTLACQVELVLSQDGVVALKAVMESHVEFKQESVEAMTKSGKITFPANILAHIASLTYSSLRGALYVKTQDTPFRDYVLPLQNLFEVIKSPYEVKIG